MLASDGGNGGYRRQTKAENAACERSKLLSFPLQVGKLHYTNS